MTCEVAIANPLAIALAADSAVTHSGIDRSTTFSSGANKIFQISNYAPVAAMIFNNSSLTGAPWELIIKSFRAHLGDRRLQYLEDYTKDLIDYLCKVPDDLISKNQRKLDMAWWYYIEAFEGLKLFEDQYNKVDLNHDQKFSFLEKLVFDIKQKNDLNKGVFFSENISLADVNSEVSNHLDSIYERIRSEASAQSDSYKKILETFGRELIVIAIHNLALFGPRNKSLFTGVVVSGFGEDQFYPGYQCIHFYGYFNSKILYKESSTKRISSDGSNSFLETFAQSSMVETFSQGMSPDVAEAVSNAFPFYVEKICKEVHEKSNTELDVQVLRDCISAAADDFLREWSYKVYDSHLAPLWGVISSLGLTELAELAETMVSLQSLKERVTHRTQSVGGPIDVVVITKSDGLIWVKRKLYFDPALNHRYFGRLQQQLGGSNEQ